jgi:vacuolar protein sorting-associated protein 13A/C
MHMQANSDSNTFCCCRYVELGHVVVPAIEEPPLNIVRVMRADLVAPGKLYHAPVWSASSSDNLYWQCDIWQVDNACSTFVAVRHDGSGNGVSRPDPSLAGVPRY